MRATSVVERFAHVSQLATCPHAVIERPTDRTPTDERGEYTRDERGDRRGDPRVAGGCRKHREGERDGRRARDGEDRDASRSSGAMGRVVVRRSLVGGAPLA